MAAKMATGYEKNTIVFSNMPEKYVIHQKRGTIGEKQFLY